MNRIAMKILDILAEQGIEPIYAVNDNICISIRVNFDREVSITDVIDIYSKATVHLEGKNHEHAMPHVGTIISCRIGEKTAIEASFRAADNHQVELNIFVF